MSRKRDLKPDEQGRYRPHLGWKADVFYDEDGTPRLTNRRQHRFNLGTDKREAERRLARLRELWDENCRAHGEEVWTPLPSPTPNHSAGVSSRANVSRPAVAISGLTATGASQGRRGRVIPPYYPVSDQGIPAVPPIGSVGPLA